MFLGDTNKTDLKVLIHGTWSSQVVKRKYDIKCKRSVVTHSGEDGSQRADCQDEQQDFSHCKCDVVCNQPAPQHVNTQKNIERKTQHWEQSTSQQLHIEKRYCTE